jgi:Acyltransferase family
MTARDTSIDTVRAYAIAGVVGGHWLVTGLVLGHDGVLRQSSPLAAMPAFAPLTWLFQTLGLFFFAGGYAATRSGRRRVLPRGLVRPLTVLAGGWAVALGVAAALGVPAGTLRTVAMLVVSPLWFLLPYLALSAATGPLIRLIDRTGPAVAVTGVAVVAVSDLGLVPAWAAVLAAWSVPWVLGVALARGRLGGSGPRLAIAGAAGLAVLIGLLGYPVSAVGVPGQGRSNLDPPSLVAVALAVAQIGVFLMLRPRLRRPSAAVGALNRGALPIYLGHQSVLILVTAVAALTGPTVPGLLGAPDGPDWALLRLAWLPVLATVLGLLRMGGSRHLGRVRAH